ncbi:hypothetical protein ACIQ1D_07050 [Lysinibacillus xylanilyticus]|uniref:hypothetical protein n=1 Tax=Lysinibacillus xylanilyticus TaxID=582475 RepID=UPI00382C26CA
MKLTSNPCSTKGGDCSIRAIASCGNGAGKLKKMTKMYIKIMDSYKNLYMWIEDNKYERLKIKWHLEIFRSWEDSEDLDVELLDTIE